MKNKLKYSDLLENLPDYITGKLENRELIYIIENEINSNHEFKNEFILMKNYVENISKIETPIPEDAYFSNLLPKLNEKLSHGVENKRVNIFDLFLKWKFALSFSIIFIAASTFFIYKYNYNSDSDYFVKDVKNSFAINDSENINKLSDGNVNMELNILANEDEEDSNEPENGNKLLYTQSVQKRNTGVIYLDESEILEDIPTMNQEEEGNYQEELDVLPEEQQIELINNFKI